MSRWLAAAVLSFVASHGSAASNAAPAAGMSVETECALRRLALEFALHLQPWRDPGTIADALLLSSAADDANGRCGLLDAGSGATMAPSSPAPPAPAGELVLHVAPPPAGDDLGGNGSVEAPFATPHRARDYLRGLRDGLRDAGQCSTL